MIATDELMEFLRAEPEDAALVQSLEAAAVELINQAGRYFGPTKTVVEHIPHYGGVIQLENEPGALLLEESVGGVWTAIPATDYHLAGRLLYLNGYRRFRPPAHLRVSYTAGYAPKSYDPNVWDAPEPIKQAVRMLVGHWYTNREAVTVGTTSADVRMGVQLILAQYR